MKDKFDTQFAGFDALLKLLIVNYTTHTNFKLLSCEWAWQFNKSYAYELK